MKHVKPPSEITVQVHHEAGAYWATVDELPGVFAAGDTEDEVFESLAEGIRLYLSEQGGTTVANVRFGDRVLVESEVKSVKRTLVSA
jgi:predicted RNase H-like HicB family nuclease